MYRKIDIYVRHSLDAKRVYHCSTNRSKTYGNSINLDKFSSVSNVTGAHGSTSGKYAFIPTKRVLGVMAEHGWFPTKVQQASTRAEHKAGFQKHIVRLQNEIVNRQADMMEFKPEIVLINAHDGLCSFKLLLGAYRMLCMNGLIVGDTYQSHSIKHIGYTDQAVSDSVSKLMFDAPKVCNQIEQFKSVNLEFEEQLAFAKSAIELKHDPEQGNYQLNPTAINYARRQGDVGSSLWLTMNRIQENLIRGGTRGTSENAQGRTQRRRDRAINSIDKNTLVNRALWTLTEEMAKLKA